MITSSQRTQIEAYLKHIKVTKYTINDDGTVDAHEPVVDDLSFIKWGRVDNDFHCDMESLISLEGAPSHVQGNFSCTSNNLTTLEGGPKEVAGWYCCGRNKLTSLRGAPLHAGRFDCTYNALTSYEGAPSTQHFLADLANLLAIYDVGRDQQYVNVSLYSSGRVKCFLHLSHFSVPKSQFIERMIERGLEQYL